jgi:phage gp36-like protein
MGYAAVADVRAVLAKDQFHPESTAASLSDDQISEAIQDASDQVDAAIGFTYPTPFTLTPYPRLVVQVTRDIAAYLADLTYRGTVDYATGDPVVARYTRAQQVLKDLQSGAARLVDWPPVGDPTLTDLPSTEAGSIVGPAGGYNASSVTAPDLVNGLITNADPRIGYPRPYWNDGSGWGASWGGSW